MVQMFIGLWRVALTSIAWILVSMLIWCWGWSFLTRTKTPPEALSPSFFKWLYSWQWLKLIVFYSFRDVSWRQTIFGVVAGRKVLEFFIISPDSSAVLPYESWATCFVRVVVGVYFDELELFFFLFLIQFDSSFSILSRRLNLFLVTAIWFGRVDTFSRSSPDDDRTWSIFLASKKDTLLLCFTSSIFFFLFCSFAMSCISRVILLAVCTSSFHQVFFLHGFLVFPPAFGTCVLSSTSFPVMSIFLTFEGPQASRDVLFDPLNTIADFFFLGNVGLVEFLDVGVGFDIFSFSNRNSSYVCDPLFSQGCRHLLFCCQRQLLIPDNYFWCVEFFLAGRLCIWLNGRFFFNMFSACLRLSTSTSKFQFLIFWTFFGVILVEITFSIRKGEKLTR